VGIAALLSAGCCGTQKQGGSAQKQSQPGDKSAVAASGPTPVTAAPPAPVPEVIKTTLDSGTIARGVRVALGEPSRFSWESVAVTSLDVSGGAVRTEVTRLGGDRVSARIHGDNIFTVNAAGHGDRDTPLSVSFTLRDLEAQLSFATRQADVAATARIVGKAGCRVWTRAKNQKTSPWSRVTFRMTAVPQDFDVQVRLRVRVSIQVDGTVILTLLSWAPSETAQEIGIKMVGQKLPDGWATIQPLDAETVRVKFDLPFDAGDRTIQNPLKAALGKVMNRDFPIGKLAQ